MTVDKPPKDPKKYFKVYASENLYEEIQIARDAGRRHGGKIISNGMCFEIGARILLGMGEDEEEKLQNDLNELLVKESEIAQKKRLKFEQLKTMQTTKAVKLEHAAIQNDNVQKLANRILEVWDNVTILGKRSLIGSLVDIDSAQLNRTKLEAVFPRTYSKKPSDVDAIKIALDLLGYEGESVGA